jgi:NAD(P)H-nitrite reductase large subunit
MTPDWLSCAAGWITDTATMRKICDVAERYGVQSIKLTSAQRIALIGIREEELDNAGRTLRRPPARSSVSASGA